MGYTPFFMVYGAKAVLPTSLNYGALRVMQYREQEAKEYLEDALDQLDELAMSCSSTLPNTSRHYNCWIKVRAFNVGNLVLCLV
jgi:hypothetical protein